MIKDVNYVILRCDGGSQVARMVKSPETVLDLVFMGG